MHIFYYSGFGGDVLAYSERELLARLVQCEAGGEGENGMKGVASVVMNRVRAPVGEYARVGMGNIRNIIHQENQFTCLKEFIEGEYNAQNIYNMNPGELEYAVADWALDGNRLYNLGEALWFFNPYSPTCPSYFPTGVGTFVTRIGDHCFYNPTSLYELT